MLKKEFDEEYKFPDVLEEASKFMFVDIFMVDGLLMGIVFMIVITRNILVVLSCVGLATILSIGYWKYKRDKKSEILNNNKFTDLTIFCEDGSIDYQLTVDSYYIAGVDDEYVIVNNDFVLDTTAIFKGGYRIEDILTYVDDKVLTKYGLGQGPIARISTTYHGEYVLNEKTIPILMIRTTSSMMMELSK